ncbi:MAG: hypothetical protein IKN29_04210, partial [Bacteroidales bacterium]|nr:hypothetical protein [Bacteroidales bacterium]
MYIHRCLYYIFFIFLTSCPPAARQNGLPGGATLPGVATYRLRNTYSKKRRHPVFIIPPGKKLSTPPLIPHHSSLPPKGGKFGP